MTALLQLGAFVGAAMSGFFADRYSRKASIGASNVSHHPETPANLQLLVLSSVHSDREYRLLWMF
jgi:MFS family permease